MALASQSPGVDPQLTGLLAVFAALGGLGVKGVDLLLGHLRRDRSTSVAIATLQQHEQVAILETAAAIRQELRSEIDRLLRRIADQEQQIVELRASILQLRDENAALRTAMARCRSDPPAWCPIFTRDAPPQ